MFDAEFLYTPLDEAVSELKKRKQDTELRSFINGLLGTVPKPLDTESEYGVFVRYIATPSFEFDSFYKQAMSSDLTPLALELARDKFVAKNWVKYCLCKLSFTDHVGSDAKVLNTKKIVDFNANEGKNLSDIETVSGENLVDVHHRILKHRYGTELLVSDFSDWFLPNRGGDKWSYYLRYLCLFICDGILFENFLTDNSELEFTRDVVAPSFKTIHDVTGYRPLIVRAIPAETENERSWCYYDKEIENSL